MFNIRGIVFKVLLPWNEGIILTPDWGYDEVANTNYATWLSFHFRVIMKDRKPFPMPQAPKATPAETVEVPTIK